MIRVHRPPAPSWAAVLEQQERRRLAGLLGDPPTRAPNKEELGDAYQRTKAELYLAQHKKCCYCERQTPFRYNPVEHFRPKLRAERGGKQPLYGYWWLAWRWENLLFSCVICNSSHKRDQFPLADGSAALVPCQDPEGSEQPLLVNPAAGGSADPRQHIQFRPVLVHGQEEWFPFGCTDEGTETIKKIGLDRPDLLDDYRTHAADIRRNLTLLGQVATRNDVGLLLQTWEDFKDRFLRSDRPLLALAYDALEHYLPTLDRQGLGLPSSSF